MLDSGGETNMILEATAVSIGAKIKPTTQAALQADGKSHMSVKGETSVTLYFGNKPFKFEGLVVEHLDVPVLAGMPFLKENDVLLHPFKSSIIFSDGTVYKYEESALKPPSQPFSVRKISSHIVRAPSTNTTLYPGDSIEVDVPPDLEDQPELALEPRLNNSPVPPMWPQPAIVTPVCGKVRITNETEAPLLLRKNEQFGQLLGTSVPIYDVSRVKPPTIHATTTQPAIGDISVDPHNVLPTSVVSAFHDVNKQFSNVFNKKGKLYNGAFGPLEAVVNMGPTLPPQRKGRVPQYSRNKLVELQDKFDELEDDYGVFAPPDEVGVAVEYLNPSFLVNKPSGGYRLVTSFGEVAKYAKPQPALMPDINETLRLIGTWKYIIKTDLSSAYY